MPRNRSLPTPPRSSTAPGPRGYPLLGILPQMRQDPLQCLMEAACRYGGVVSLPLGPKRAYLMAHPDSIKHVLQDNHRNYRKDRRIDKLKPLLGNGLFMSEGAFWYRQRRLMQPAFHRQRIAALATAMVEAIEEMLQHWRAYAERGTAIDIAAEMMQLTLNIIGKTMFGADISLEEAQSVGWALPTVLAHLKHPHRREFQHALQTLNQIVFRIIDQRRRDGTAREDLLALLLDARDEETGAPMSDTQLRDEVMTIFLAGHETTATALTWTWYLLATHPEEEERLHKEIAGVLGGRTPTFQDLSSLPLTRMVIEEAMRLYPPIWLTSRIAVADDHIGGYAIPANAVIFLSPYVMHRHPDFWDHPTRFDPERFLPERVAARPRYAYFPFLGGPRQCIGNNFALIEAQLIVALITRSYQLRLTSTAPVDPHPGHTLRPRQPILMLLHPRSAGA